MNGPARLLLASAVVIVSVSAASGQVTIQPTPAPLVSAENETWFRTGEPLAFAGNLYYPAGAAIHFLPNEMVRTGAHRGIPLYARTTIEPFSMIFVPIGGGLMQPYERRRDLDLAGTQGSTAPAISPALSPSVGPTTAASALGAPSPAIAQAAAPPFIGAPVIVDQPSAPDVAATPAPEPVATTGRMTATPRPPARVRRDAANAIYVEFDNTRWFSAGQPVSLDARSLTLVGDLHGFPVYAPRPAGTTIYIPIAHGVDTVAAYRKRK